MLLMHYSSLTLLRHLHHHRSDRFSFRQNTASAGVNRKKITYFEARKNGFEIDISIGGKAN